MNKYAIYNSIGHIIQTTVSNKRPACLPEHTLVEVDFNVSEQTHWFNDGVLEEIQLLDVQSFYDINIDEELVINVPDETAVILIGEKSREMYFIEDNTFEISFDYLGNFVLVFECIGYKQEYVSIKVS